MPSTLHDFIEHATQKVCAELLEALAALPEDKRGWKPGPKARTALDQVAECAIINDATVGLIQTRKWVITDRDLFMQQKAALAEGSEEALHTLLRESTTRAVKAMRTVPDDTLNEDVILPWGSEKLADTLMFPYWNMSYHTGQITYINSLIPDSE